MPFAVAMEKGFFKEFKADVDGVLSSAFSLTLIGTLLGEMFGAQRGLGFLLMQAMSLHEMERIMSLTLLLVVFAACANAALLALERRLA